VNNYLHEGTRLTVTAPYTVSSGGGVKVGNIFGIAAYDAVLNDSLEVLTRGVVSVAKDASTFAQGDLVYWDDTAKKVTSVVGSNMLVGIVEVAAATGVATVAVKLFGVTAPTNGVRVARMLYDFTVDGGAISTITPAISDTIPKDAIVFGGTLNSTVAPVGASATVAIGTVAGSASNSILTATAITSLTLDAVLKVTCTATPFKMTAAGKMTVTIATTALTAGQIEAWVIYVPATND